MTRMKPARTSPILRRRLSRISALAIAAGTVASASLAATTGASAATASTHASRRAPAGQALSTGTEHFHVGSTRPGGPGTIIVTGVINAGGIEHPGSAVDHAAFSGGGFRIDHSSGHATVRFNPQTCVGTITQSGPFHVFDGTGRFAELKGAGTYRFGATYTTTRTSTGCTKTMTAYIETINGTITVP